MPRGFPLVMIFVLIFGQLGADVNAVDHTGLTALHRSVVRGHIQVTEPLLKGGARVDACMVVRVAVLLHLLLDGVLLPEEDQSSMTSKLSTELQAYPRRPATLPYLRLIHERAALSFASRSNAILILSGAWSTAFPPFAPVILIDT